MYSIEEFDNAKSKVVKYISYKRKTEQQIRQKFINSINENLLDDIIQYLKEAEYIDDSNHLQKTAQELIRLNNLSIKELKNKLFLKGFEKDLVEDYFLDLKEELINYEIQSAKILLIKKSNTMNEEETIQYLLKKGYNLDNIKTAIEEI